MKHAPTGGGELPDSNRVSPLDGVLGAVALGAPMVAEVATSEGSMARYVLAGVAAAAGVLLVTRLDRSDNTGPPPYEFDLYGTL